MSNVFKKLDIIPLTSWVYPWLCFEHSTSPTFPDHTKCPSSSMWRLATICWLRFVILLGQIVWRVMGPTHSFYWTVFNNTVNGFVCQRMSNEICNLDNSPSVVLDYKILLVSYQYIHVTTTTITTDAPNLYPYHYNLRVPLTPVPLLSNSGQTVESLRFTSSTPRQTWQSKWQKSTIGLHCQISHSRE